MSNISVQKLSRESWAIKKDAMLSESMSQKKRENNRYLDARQKERKQWVQRHLPVRIKDSTCSQRFQKERSMTFEFKNTKIFTLAQS
jgi:hypothetical protein